ncbi:Saccharopine dehydrogenase-domain-containing protein [Lentinula raphanica]|nr:Saccharopine dehydrogenase-domain-containing protein [Lentinula raphanica]
MGMGIVDPDGPGTNDTNEGGVRGVSFVRLSSGDEDGLGTGAGGLGGLGGGGEIDRLVKEVDVVISLLPPALHTPLARLCIAHQTHLITPSYISPEMRALDGAARNAGGGGNPGGGEGKGILILCEIGLDPGLDHVGAVELVERARARMGAGESGEGEREREIQSFVSFCGGLPEPRLVLPLPSSLQPSHHEPSPTPSPSTAPTPSNESPESPESPTSSSSNTYPPSGGPLSYKFSWSPRGVLEAALNGARYVLDGMEVVVPAHGEGGGGGGGVGGNKGGKGEEGEEGEGKEGKEETEGGILAEDNMFPASDLLFDFGYLTHEGGDRLKGLEGLLEGIPNRDSLPYASMYGLDSPKPTQTLRTLLRGTLRYKGFSALMDRFRKQGFLDRQSRVRVDDLMMMMSDFEGSEDVDADADADDTVGGGGVLEGKKERERIWKEVVRRIRSDNRYESGNGNGNGWNGKNGEEEEEEEEDPLDRPLAWLLSADTGTPPLSHSNSTWIGLPPLPLPPPLTSNPSNPSNPSKPPNPQTHMSPIDLFTALLSHKLQYGSGERDMVVLVHEVVTRDVGVSVSVSVRRGRGRGRGRGGARGGIQTHRRTDPYLVLGHLWFAPSNTPPKRPRRVRV